MGRSVHQVQIELPIDAAEDGIGTPQHIVVFHFGRRHDLPQRRGCRGRVARVEGGAREAAERHRPEAVAVHVIRPFDVLEAGETRAPRFIEASRDPQALAEVCGHARRGYHAGFLLQLDCRLEAPLRLCDGAE